MDERRNETYEVGLPCSAADDLHRNAFKAGPLPGTNEYQKRPAGWSQRCGDPGEGKTLIKNPMQCVEGHDRVEPALIRHRADIAELERQIAASGGNRDHPRRRVETDDIRLHDPARDLGGDPAVPTADVEQAANSIEGQAVKSAVG